MKKIMKLICLFIATGISGLLYSQTTWYFGNGAGIKFTGTVPAPSAPPAGTIYGTSAAGEGSSVLVDAANNVIMFSNGINIWNGNGVIQGAPYQLGGNSSSTQTAVIVPVPGSSTSSSIQKAYIFTVNCAETAYGNGTNLLGLRVSLASITGVAPNCTITILPADLNVLLTPPTFLMDEKLCVTNFVVDNTGKGGYWVITHGVGAYTLQPATPGYIGIVTHTATQQPGETTFYAYHVTCATNSVSLLAASEKQSSINPSLVAEHRSWNHPGYNNLDVNTGVAQPNAQGQMKFSQDGKKLACTLAYYGNAQTSSGWAVNPVLQLYDFDINTGAVGGAHDVQFNLGFNHTNSTAKDGDAYGLEFSPNGNYLYISSTFGCSRLAATATDGITTRIYRYDITTWLPVANGVVPGASYLDVNDNLGSYAAMQLGPDNKIYVARKNSGTLSTIGNPNSSTIAGTAFAANSTPVAGTCLSGLPTTVLVAQMPSTPVITAAPHCSGSDITVTGGYTGEIPSSHYWEIWASDASGNPVNTAGVITYPSWFDYNTWNVGTTPGVFTFPGTSTLPCGKYYTVKLALTDGCSGSWTETTQTFYLTCTPVPVITGNLDLCYGASTTLCVNYAPSGGHGGVNDAWIYSTAVSPQCITVSPTATTSYPVWVTQNGCTGTTSATVTVKPNYTNFGLSSNQTPVTNPYYTAVATPTIDPGPVLAADPTFGYFWVVEEVDVATGTIVVPNTTVTNPDSWWLPTNANDFKGYIGNTTGNYATCNTGPCFNGPAGSPVSTTPGQFLSGHKYRVTYATWSNTCPWTSLTAVMYHCGVCRMADGSNGTIEYGNLTYDNPMGIGVTTSNESGNSQIFIFPNPSTGDFVVNLPGAQAKSVMVYDVLGNIVFEKDNTTDQTLALDLTDKANGIYVVKVISGTEVVSTKIVKQ